MASPIMKSRAVPSSKIKESAMEPTDLTCKTAESVDGTIKIQSAEEDQEKRKKETVSIDQVLSLKKEESVTELMAQICKIAVFQDGTTRTQSAEEDQEKRKKETVSIDQVLSLKWKEVINHLHSHNATQCTSQRKETLPAELELSPSAITLHSHNAMLCSNQKREV
jgi:hypothetical protein